MSRLKRGITAIFVTLMLLVATIPLNSHSKASASSENFIIDFRINVSYGLGWRVDTPESMPIIPGKEYKLNLINKIINNFENNNI